MQRSGYRCTRKRVFAETAHEEPLRPPNWRPSPPCATTRVDRWQGEERSDSTRWISKEKIGYLADSIQGAQAVGRGQCEGLWNASLGWIERARVDEELELESPEMGVALSYALAGHLQLLESGSYSAATVDWESDWDSPGGTDELLSSDDGLQFEHLRSELAGATVEQLVLEIVAALETHGMESYEVFDAMTRLAGLLELEPSQALELEELLRTMPLSVEAIDVAMAAFGQAATPQAQDALARFAVDVSLPEALRTAALRSAFQLHAPGAGLVDSVASLFGTQAPLAVEGTALLLLGRLTNGEVRLPDGQLDGLMQKLLQLESDAAALEITDVWLEALGNAGLAESVPEIVPYLYDPAAHVRAAAVAALRNIDTPAAAQALLGVVHQDAEPGIRAEALGILADHGTASAVQTVCELARSDGHAVVRKAAIMALAADAGSDAQRAALEWCAEHDPLAELRELASSILDGA